MTSSSPKRRPVDFSSLEKHISKLKIKDGIARDDSRKKTVSIDKGALCPIIQADVGAQESTDVFRYRLLIPIAQIIARTPDDIRRVVVASGRDLTTIQNAFIRHFGGATFQLQEPSPIRGEGARDPSNVAGTREQNEHVIFEVYAAPIHASDEYFRAVRRELEEALGEGVILIERQRVTLI
ncbi:MAG TPA: hypothetical protein VFW87_07620 [Pirellulales bacterium]|nr:hypothetical protein [Pirellulales bacterium]